MQHERYFALALKAAARDIVDVRTHAIGAVAIRADGALVTARNGFDRSLNPSMHAEHRVMRKAGHNAIVYVARHRKNGSAGLAKPCVNCMSTLRNKGAERVYYTIADNEFGCIQLNPR